MPWAFTAVAIVQDTSAHAAHQETICMVLRVSFWALPSDSIGGCIQMAISHNSRSICVPDRQTATVHRGPKEIRISLSRIRISESTA